MKDKQFSPSRKQIGGLLAVVAALLCTVFGVRFGDIFPETAAPQTTAAQTREAGALRFANEKALREHFEKHGREMGFAAAEDYLAAANAVVENPQALYKLEAEDGDHVYYLASSGEIVFVSQKGVIRTYFIADDDYFERQ